MSDRKKEGEIETEENEYLVRELGNSNILGPKSLSYKCKIIIIVCICIFVAGIISATVFLLIKESSDSDKGVEDNQERDEEDPIEVLPPIIINPAKDYTHCIIWLHGMDNCPENFQELFKIEVPFIKEENTKIILMRAPYMIMSFNQQNVTSWFDLYSFPINNSECYNYTDITKSRRMLEKIINQEAKKLNGNYQNIFVGGHSQGAIVSLYTAYNFKELLGGVLVCSGILLNETEIVGDKNKLKVFLAHGFKDQAIPLFFHNETVKRIENFEGVKKFYYENLGHNIANYEKFDMSGFLNDSMIEVNHNNKLFCSLIKILLLFILFY